MVSVRLPGVDNARDILFQKMRAQEIGVNVHYIPIHLHPFYRDRFNTGPGLCPVAESAARTILSLPMFPGMSNQDIETVCKAVKTSVEAMG